MSLKKKDPSLRVAANDPHLVSLGGGRLSTAVTIHYIPIGDMTIGSSPTCSVSLNGSGVRPTHCTIYRSEDNEVTIVPEREARTLIDGTKLDGEANLTQGAMITIGNSNYLRFNNPAEAQLIRSTMGSNERISMPQIDFTQVSRCNSGRSSHGSEEAQLEAFYESKIHPKETKLIENIDINGLTCPKVFTADSITVNTPAKDVLGPKYANFAKNLAENHRNEKNQKMNNYVNIPTSSFKQNGSNLNSSSSSSINGCGGNEIPGKVNNNLSNNRNTNSYDKYPKSYGGLQLFPMNGLNSEINTSVSSHHGVSIESSGSHNSSQPNISVQESERLEEILKICTEYERQNQSITSSPIVQNRIKTNGSLPREKKGPFNELSPQLSGSHSKIFFPDKAKISSGYENVRIIGDRRVEIGGGGTCGNSIGSPYNGSQKSGYENVVVGKYVPQSPRTKIRTTCMSPKRDTSLNGSICHNHPHLQQSKQSSNSDYDQLIQTFEDKLKMEMQAIQDSNRLVSPASSNSNSPSKRTNKNINNLTLNLDLLEKVKEKPVPAVRTVKTNMTVPVTTSSTHNPSPEINVEKLKKSRKDLQRNIQKLKTQIADLQRQEDETLREMDMEKALVSAELTSIKDTLGELESSFTALQNKVHCLEIQRNATRVMEENQQTKLKQSIAIKQDQVKRLKNMLKEKPTDDCIQEEYDKCSESLENDRKTFEDLEFQYLEEESEWQAYREEMHIEQKNLSIQIGEKQNELRRMEEEEAANHSNASSDARAIKGNILALMNELQDNQERMRALDTKISDITGDLNGHSNSSSEDDHEEEEEADDESESSPTENQHGIMSQSLFGSAELLCPKRHPEDIMSKSVNENMFYNNKIELPSQQPVTSTPKRPLKPVDIADDLINSSPALPPRQNKNTEDSSSVEDQVVRRMHKEEKDPLLKLKYNVNSEEQGERVNFNLSLGSDDFEVNPLERRIPSQDDIDRISKVTSDAPISTKGASNKIFDSIKEIERNRQLLLAQQGCHVIEHERQKMVDLKKKSHDEARAQYLSMLSTSLDNSTSNKNDIALAETDNLTDRENQQEQVGDATDKKIGSIVSSNSTKHDSAIKANSTNSGSSNDQNESSQNRHSQPELDSQRSRPLSDANSELSCNLLSDNTYKSSIELSTSVGGNGNRHSEQSDDGKRSSVNSSDTTNSDRLTAGNKRALPKHQRPLTRYLPIFSPDLDLRQHIESAGHQITQCPHVFVDSYSCRGYLHKLGATFHGWSRRWFVLDRQRNAFIYYSDKSERKPRGGAYFSTIDEVYLDHLNASKSGRPHCTFIVKTKKRSYHLQAASDSAARIWIDAIITGAQGNLDY